MALTTGEVGERLATIRSRIEQAGGDPDEITVVAVTKDFGPDAVEAAVANGLLDCGENRADQLVTKAMASSNVEASSNVAASSSVEASSNVEAGTTGVRWHYLGQVQRNKVPGLAPHVDLWQALDRVAAGEEIAKRAPGASVLVQVNVSGETQKHGCEPADVPTLVDALGALGLDVQGLMAVGPTGSPEAARPGFRSITALADRLQLPVRSMGMTDDMEVAVQEGSTMVRIGRALFGDRPRPEGRDLRR